MDYVKRSITYKVMDLNSFVILPSFDLTFYSPKLVGRLCLYFFETFFNLNGMDFSVC